MFKPAGTVTGLYREDCLYNPQGSDFVPYTDVTRECKPANSTFAVPTSTYDNYEVKVRAGGGPATVVTKSNPRASYPFRNFSYQSFLGAAQGSINQTSSSNLAPNDPQRVSVVQQVMRVPGVKGISYVFPWEAIEPVAPNGSAHVYNWQPLDYAIQETAAYDGAQCIIRVNAGGNIGSPNWMIGGATGTLSQNAPEAPANHIHVMLPDSRYAAPATTQTIQINAPGAFGLDCRNESFTINAVSGSGLGPYDLTLSGNVTRSHLAGGVVEWSSAPLNWVTATAYTVGQQVIMPAGTLLNSEDKSNLTYVVTQGCTAAQNNGTSSQFLDGRVPNLCELGVFATDGTAMPVPWDPTMLAARQAFITAMGTRYNGNPYLAIMQMAGAGYLGEMDIVGPGSSSPQTKVATWIPHGYTDWRFIAAWNSYVDYYAAAFTKTPLALDVDEPHIVFTWPSVVTSAVTCTTNSTATVTCTNTTGIVQGMIITIDAGSVACGIPSNTYVGTVTANTSFLLSSSPITQVNVNATAGSTQTLHFNSSSRVDTITSTNENAPITDTSITQADQGKQVTGAGISANRFVGTVTTGVSFLLSTSRVAQVTPASHVISATSATIAFVGSYNNNGAGFVTQAVGGSNAGGSLGGPNSDTYSGGTPIIGYTGSTYPYRIYMQQNGLNNIDYQALNQGQFRELVSGCNPVGATSSYTTMQNLGGGNQMSSILGSDLALQQALEVAFDDGNLYLETYWSDITLDAVTAGYCLTWATGGRP